MDSPLRLYDFYIFERSGRELYRASPTLDEKGKLVYGLLFSLKQMIPTLSSDVSEEGIRSLTTSAFTMHAFESVTGYRFALVSSVADQAQQNKVRALLERIFAEFFVELVQLDPTHEPGQRIESKMFVNKLNMALASVGGFASNA